MVVVMGIIFIATIIVVILWLIFKKLMEKNIEAV